MKVVAKYTKEKDPAVLAELYRIYGVKHLDKIPYVKPDAVEAILRSEVKGAENAKPAEFIDNTIVSSLEQEGLFRKLYP